MRHLCAVFREKVLSYLSVLTAASLLFLFIGLPKAADAELIFILHSYHQEYPWTRHENTGLVNALETHFADGNMTVSTEYLDTKRIEFTREYQEFFTQYLQKKYKGYRPDIIFVSDDNALQFMVQHRREIFPGVPMVFCGVNNLSLREQLQQQNIYGVFEEKAVTGNLHLMKKLFPEIESVTFVGDDSPTYQAIYQQILESAADELPGYNFSFRANRDIQQIENLLKASPDKVIVLTTIGAFQEQEHTNISISSTLRRIRRLGDFAIIIMEDVYMQDGIFGGIVASGLSQGERAAQIGIQLLSGSLPASERFVIGANIPTFNYGELQRFKISESLLPADAVVLNQPISFVKEYKEIVIATILIFVTLCTLISFLLLTLVRKKKAERELKASRNFLTSVLDNLPDMVFVKNAKDLCFVRLNKAGEKIFGKEAAQIVGKNDYDFFPKEEADFFTTTDREVLSRKDLLDIPVEPIQTQSGSRFLHTKKIPLFDEHGVPAFLLGISRDITAEKLAEREKLELQDKLKQAQKMEAIGTLAGGIAHDFNNILSAIIGYTQLAQLQPDISDQLKKYLVGISKGAERARQLVRQILTFSRKNEQNHEIIVFSEVVKESLDLLRCSLPSTITIKQDLNSCCHILADATQLHQVVMNLCTNSYHAMQETGGIIKVTLNEIEVLKNSESPLPGMKTGRYVQLSVSDSGKGMDKAVIDRIFDPYFTTKGPEAGTGLGLAVVHGIIKNHGGVIGVESQPDIGTTINVYLPLPDTAIHPLVTGEVNNRIDAYKPGKGEQILFVDDEPEIVKTTTNLLKLHGYDVTSFTSSKEALLFYEEHKELIDLVITDMTMPDLTGAELSAKILDMNPDATIIICTGFSDGINREKAKAMGIRGYCEKPVSLDCLLGTISDILSLSYARLDL